tara:strand:- start:227 stop:460 length:234 start_codon:yes stop_codon:yes gene_type:complete
MKETDLRYSEKIKFNKEQVKRIVEQENFDVCIKLDGCDLIKVDNWILEQIRKRDDTQFRYVGMLFGSQERVMRIWTK